MPKALRSPLKKTGTSATIFMPLATPRMKQLSVQRHGGSAVDIHLIGNSYDEASSAALAYSRENKRTYIHAYDDLAVMGRARHTCG